MWRRTFRPISSSLERMAVPVFSTYWWEVRRNESYAPVHVQSYLSRSAGGKLRDPRRLPLTAKWRFAVY